MAKLQKTKAATEARYKAAITDLQTILAGGGWVAINAGQFGMTHSVCQGLLKLMVKRGILESRKPPGKSTTREYRRTVLLNHLSPQALRGLNIDHQSAWYPSRGWTPNPAQTELPTDANTGNKVTVPFQMDADDVRLAMAAYSIQTPKPDAEPVPVSHYRLICYNGIGVQVIEPDSIPANENDCIEYAKGLIEKDYYRTVYVVGVIATVETKPVVIRH